MYKARIVSRGRFAIFVASLASIVLGLGIIARYGYDNINQGMVPIDGNEGYYLLILLALPLILYVLVRHVGRDAMFRFIEIQLGVRFFDANNIRIRVAVYGVGGAGKSTLLAALFRNDRRTQALTEGLHESLAWSTYKGRRKEIVLIDYEGQKEAILRDRLRELAVNEEPVHVVMFVVSFFGVDKNSGRVLVPEGIEERLVEIKDHVKLQMEEIAPPIIREIFRSCSALHSVFLVINQIDLIERGEEGELLTNAQRVAFADRYFGELRDRIGNILRHWSNVNFSVSYVSASKGFEISLDERCELQGLNIGVHILENQERISKQVEL